MPELHRRDHAIDDERRAQTRPETQEQHRAAGVAAERLHRRIVDDLHGAPERAGVDTVMGCCTSAEHEAFMDDAPRFEQLLVRSGMLLWKCYLDISKRCTATRARSARPSQRSTFAPVKTSIRILHSRPPMSGPLRAPRPTFCSRSLDHGSSPADLDPTARVSEQVVMAVRCRTTIRQALRSLRKIDRREASDHESLHYTCARRNRSALPITDTELKLIAAAAIIGDRSSPKNG